MLFNPLPSIVRLAVALIGLALLASYGWSLSHQDVPMDLLARQQPHGGVHQLALARSHLRVLHV